MSLLCSFCKKHLNKHYPRTYRIEQRKTATKVPECMIQRGRFTTHLVLYEHSDDHGRNAGSHSYKMLNLAIYTKSGHSKVVNRLYKRCYFPSSTFSIS